MASPPGSIGASVDAVEKTWGKGPTLSTAEQKHVLYRGAPAWLVLGARLDGTLGERCRRELDQLAALFAEVGPRVGITGGSND